MLLTILLDVVGPIIVLIGIGAFLRLKFKLDLPTLSKLNIYFAVPAFIFHTVSTSKLPFSDMGGIALMTVLQVLTLAILIFGGGRLLKVQWKTLSAVALAVMFYNSSNYGLPLAELAYPKQLASTTGRDGGAVQAFVLMTQNLLTFTVGLGDRVGGAFGVRLEQRQARAKTPHATGPDLWLGGEDLGGRRPVAAAAGADRQACGLHRGVARSPRPLHPRRTACQQPALAALEAGGNGDDSASRLRSTTDGGTAVRAPQAGHSGA